MIEKVSEEKSQIKIGVVYVLSLSEEVRHVLGISDESVIAQCVCEKSDKHSAVGFLVPCIWGMHFFTPSVLGPEISWIEWKAQKTPA